MTTRVSDWTDNKRKVNDSPFTPGQAAQIYFGNMPPIRSPEADIAAWQQTGLFTSVTRSSSDVPTASGIYMRVNCSHLGGDDRTNIITFMMWAMSLAIIPSGPQIDRYACTTEVFQNALPFKTGQAEVAFFEYRSGWALIPAWLSEASGTRQLERDSAAIRVNSTLATLK